MEQKQELKLYRKRILPPECILLKNDIIVKQTPEVIVTKWNTLNPKIDFHHGSSCYFLQKGLKISKFYREDHSLLHWYCDIVQYDYQKEEHALIVTDLLADVIVSPGGCAKVVDLDELADAFEKGLMTSSQLSACLRQLDNLLTYIHRDKFDYLQSEIDSLGL